MPLIYLIKMFCCCGRYDNEPFMTHESDESDDTSDDADRRTKIRRHYYVPRDQEGELPPRHIRERSPIQQRRGARTSLFRIPVDALFYSLQHVMLPGFFLMQTMSIFLIMCGMTIILAKLPMPVSLIDHTGASVNTTFLGLAVMGLRYADVQLQSHDIQHQLGRNTIPGNNADGGTLHMLIAWLPSNIGIPLVRWTLSAISLMFLTVDMLPFGVSAIWYVLEKMIFVSEQILFKVMVDLPLWLFTTVNTYSVSLMHMALVMLHIDKALHLDEPTVNAVAVIVQRCVLWVSLLGGVTQLMRARARRT